MCGLIIHKIFTITMEFYGTKSKIIESSHPLNKKKRKINKTLRFLDFSKSALLVFHQFPRRFFDVFDLRQDEIFDLRRVGDERVGRADAANRSVEIFE